MELAKLKDLKFILMDVEGTTSDITFVKQVMFPYSYNEIPYFVKHNSSNPDLIEALDEIEKPTLDEKVIQLLAWINEDKKHPSLKSIQGMVWKRAFEEGEFKAPLYSDVLPSWKKWKDLGLGLGIYSSGSVGAQKLFFSHTKEGDVLAYLDQHFDLVTGSKKDFNSYMKISEELKLPADQILFLSDVEEELDAAKGSNMKTAQVLRPHIPPGQNHSKINTFEEII